MAKYLFTIPSRNMVVVSMGQTWGSSAACNVNLLANYDEAMTVRHHTPRPPASCMLLLIWVGVSRCGAWSGDCDVGSLRQPYAAAR